MRLEIKIQGVEEIMEQIDDLTKMRNAERAMGKACALLERKAKEECPTDTGALRRSITSKVDKSNGKIEGIVFTPLEYAPYIEYGTGLYAEDGNGRKDVPWVYQDDEGNWHSTSGQPPQPFMRPALNKNRNKVIEIIREELLND